jgi:hypothetical protein
VRQRERSARFYADLEIAAGPQQLVEAPQHVAVRGPGQMQAGEHAGGAWKVWQALQHEQQQLAGARHLARVLSHLSAIKKRAQVCRIFCQDCIHERDGASTLALAEQRRREGQAQRWLGLPRR